MNMAEILNEKFMDEIDEGIRNNYDYLKADKEIHKFINKELSKKKAYEVDELLGILTAIVGNTYAEEAIRIGAKSVVALFLG